MKVTGYLLIMLGLALIIGAAMAVPGQIDRHFIFIGSGFAMTGLCVVVKSTHALVVYGVILLYIYINALLMFLNNAEFSSLVSNVGMPTIIGCYLFINRQKMQKEQVDKKGKSE